MEPKITGIVLVKNEDIYIERVLANILEFCDEIIVTDNYSSDRTYGIIQKLAVQHPKISARRITHPRESHEAIEHYAGTNTWIFAVDGDEIYDPVGLKKMKSILKHGTFQDIWSIYGNVLNCTTINTEKKTANGYLAPPSRSMTKLYNFSLIESWTGCPERLHSGNLTLKNSTQKQKAMELYKTMDWESSYFRCLHAVFVPRSSKKNELLSKTRLNPAEIESIASAYRKKSYFKMTKRYALSLFGSNWKQKKYRRGSLIAKDISIFFP
jgi:glycosyltransferase involved in cell wall biosynthesis